MYVAQICVCCQCPQPAVYTRVCTHVQTHTHTAHTLPLRGRRVLGPASAPASPPAIRRRLLCRPTTAGGGAAGCGGGAASSTDPAGEGSVNHVHAHLVGFGGVCRGSVHYAQCFGRYRTWGVGSTATTRTCVTSVVCVTM